MNLERHEPLTFTGPSIFEMLWERMDSLTEKMMEGNASDVLKGRALELSDTLAVFTNPYDPDPKAIRAEAKRRYREGQER